MKQLVNKHLFASFLICLSAIFFSACSRLPILKNLNPNPTVAPSAIEVQLSVSPAEITALSATNQTLSDKTQASVLIQVTNHTGQAISGSKLVFKRGELFFAPTPSVITSDQRDPVSVTFLLPNLTTDLINGAAVRVYSFKAGKYPLQAIIKTLDGKEYQSNNVDLVVLPDFTVPSAP